MKYTYTKADFKGRCTSCGFDSGSPLYFAENDINSDAGICKDCLYEEQVDAENNGDEIIIEE